MVRKVYYHDTPATFNVVFTQYVAEKLLVRVGSFKGLLLCGFKSSFNNQILSQVSKKGRVECNYILVFQSLYCLVIIGFMKNAFILLLLLATCWPCIEKPKPGAHHVIIQQKTDKLGQYIYTDLENFINAYSLLGAGTDTVSILQKEYFDKGTSALKEFSDNFALDAEHLAKSIAKYPKYYDSLYDIIERISAQEPVLEQVFHKLKSVYPEGAVPTVYYLVGGFRAGGNGGEGNYILIGAEIFNLKEDTDWGEFTSERLFYPSSITHIVAHETTHILQEDIQGADNYLSIYTNEDKGTLLAYAIREGGADYFAELISGSHINPQAHDYGEIHEKALWQLFRQDMNKTDLGDWFFYTPKEIPEWPKDLGYFMGYKITESYFQNTSDQKSAINYLLGCINYDEFLEKSGYALKFE